MQQVIRFFRVSNVILQSHYFTHLVAISPFSLFLLVRAGPYSIRITLPHARLTFLPVDGGSSCHRNVGKHLLHYMA
jgi:hypothetical protein